MIAGCPKCGARYRVEREKLASGSVRLRCAKCEAVFRVRAPEAEADAQDATQLSVALAPPAAAPRAAESAPAAALAAPAAPAAAPSGDLVLVAIPEEAVAKQLAELLATRNVRSIVVHDGVDAVLELQRHLPKAVIVAAHLPKMFGFQICELVKRNESLRSTWVVLVGAIHNQDRYRRPAQETYGADAYVEMPDLPEGALALLSDGGVALRAPAGVARRSAPPATPIAPAAPRPEPAPLAEKRAVPAAAARPAAIATPPAAPRAAAPAAPERAKPADGLEEQRAKAERLARIIVSDIVLYNEQKFGEAIRRGNVIEALEGDLSEGRHLFQERIDARVRGERDYLADELLRIARSRGMK